MSSAANIVETMKAAQPGRNGAYPVVPLIGTYSTTAGTAYTLLDLNGNSLVVDFDCTLLFFVVTNEDVSGAGGSLTFYKDDTALTTAGANYADDTTTLNPVVDYSERNINAGQTLKATSANRDYIGTVTFFVIPR